MTPTVFLLGIGLTLGSTLAIVRYLRSPLQSILIELCGTRERAGFWLTFSNVTLTLVPVIFAMQDMPNPSSQSAPVFALAAQLKWALVGLLFAVLVLGWVLSSFVRKQAVPTIITTPKCSHRGPSEYLEAL